jgi:predicted outer membrane lipoprotein
MDMPFDTWVLVALVAAAFVVLAAIVVAVAQMRRRRHTGRLEETFGPSYDATVMQYGSRADAERELNSRLERVGGLELRELSTGERERYEQRWAEIRSDFIDHPAGALARAEQLTLDMMVSRGYDGAANRDRRVADLSVHFQSASPLYASASQVAARSENGASIDDMRRAMQLYGRVIEELGGVRTLDRVPADRVAAAGA